MSTFSSVACYSALSCCSQDDLLSAYARMVASLALEKNYTTIDANTLVKDFKAKFGFEIPYHPMLTIIEHCMKIGFFQYNSSTYSTFPILSKIAADDFNSILLAKDNRYKEILEQFNSFLISQHNMHSSNEDLDEKIRAFIERYGIKAKMDREILRKVKNDYFFAEFLVDCEEKGFTDVLDYLDEYTIGIALSEVFVFNEVPNSFTAKNVHAYLDAGVIFKILGIDSGNHKDSYVQFVRNMQRIGIRVYTYEHTIEEVMGIIEGSKQWIGNPNYDATLSSETAYFFVTNNWTVQKIDELSTGIRYRLENDFYITIERMSYPKVEDIRTATESCINEMIVERYRNNMSEQEIALKEKSIEKDARSIFFTQHKNGNIVPLHINDVQNVFVTTNRALASVGYHLSLSIAPVKDMFIPVVVTDVKWGTLIWFNSPSMISTINRPRLVSAAYAAFRPDTDLIKKLNARLSQLEEEGSISPEQCYLLKVNPIAQHLLAKQTMNDPNNFVDSTPFDILRELGRESFEQGSASRQAEVDLLAKQNTEYQKALELERQKRVVSNLENSLEQKITELNSVKSRKKEIGKELAELRLTKDEIEKVVANRIRTLNIVCSLIAISVIVLSVLYGKEYSWAITLITFVLEILFWLYEVWGNKGSLYTKVRNWVVNTTRENQSSLRRFSNSHFQMLENEEMQTAMRINNLESQITDIQNQLTIEKQKLDDAIISV